MVGHAKGATAITQVFGEGQKLVAGALEYDQPIDNAALSTAAFAVGGRTVTRVYANTEPTLANEGTNGTFVIIELSWDDPDAGLYVQQGRTFTRKEAEASVTQIGVVSTANGETYAESAETISTSAIRNLIVDDFRQLAYADQQSGLSIQYNLFVPKDYDFRPQAARGHGAHASAGIRPPVGPKPFHPGSGAHA